MSITRRDALKLGAVTAGAAAISGCTPSASPSSSNGASNGKILGKHTVVIIGGGWGGLTVAKEIMKADKSFDVLIIEKNEMFMSCPVSNTYLGKLEGINLGTFIHDYAQPVEKNGYKMLQAEVTGIDRGSKVVHTAKGGVEYDILVLAPGIGYDYETSLKSGMTAAKKGNLMRKAPAAMIPGGEHVALERLLADMDDGNVVITVPAGKYRCPPAPFERASMIATYMKKEEIPGKVIIINTARTIPIFKDFTLNELIHVLKNPRITKYKPNTTILSAGSDTNELYFIISGEVRAIQLSKLGTFETNENHHKGEFLNMYSFVKREKLDRGYTSGETPTTIFRFEINDENLAKSAKTFKKFYLNVASYALEKNKLYHNELNNLIL